jgi:hypothetical protein
MSAALGPPSASPSRRYLLSLLPHLLYSHALKKTKPVLLFVADHDDLNAAFLRMLLRLSDFLRESKEDALLSSDLTAEFKRLAEQGHIDACFGMHWIDLLRLDESAVGLSSERMHLRYLLSLDWILKGPALNCSLYGHYRKSFMSAVELVTPFQILPTLADPVPLALVKALSSLVYTWGSARLVALAKFDGPPKTMFSAWKTDKQLSQFDPETVNYFVTVQPGELNTHCNVYMTVSCRLTKMVKDATMAELPVLRRVLKSAAVGGSPYAQCLLGYMQRHDRLHGQPVDVVDWLLVTQAQSQEEWSNSLQIMDAMCYNAEEGGEKSPFHKLAAEYRSQFSQPAPAVPPAPLKGADAPATTQKKGMTCEC